MSKIFVFNSLGIKFQIKQKNQKSLKSKQITKPNVQIDLMDNQISDLEESDL